MSERSRLLKKVLETWDHSDEGQQYLNWLLQPEAAQLDGGDILREAVLDLIEEDDQLDSMRSKKMELALRKFLAESQLPHSTEANVRQSTTALVSGFSQQKEAIRGKAQVLRELRHALNRDRLETLAFVAQMRLSHAPSEIEAFLKQFHLAEDLAARVAALSRTRAESIDPEEEWRRLSPNGSSFGCWQHSAHDSANGWFDLVAERLEKYYSHQLVERLSGIVQRASALQPMKLDVKSQLVRSLFLEAHEVFLYGFDAAAIALCRSLVDQALRDRLSVPRNERPPLRSMINQAEDRKLLDAPECDGAKKVEEMGNKVMHSMSNMPNLQNIGQNVLDCTRIVLNKLYGDVGR